MNDYLIKVVAKNKDEASSIMENLSKYDCYYQLEQENSRKDYNYQFQELPYTRLGEKTGRTTDEYKRDLAYYNNVSNILVKYGLSPDHKGFKYAIECIRLMNTYGLESYTMDMDVYPIVSKWYKVTPASVEHNIRNAINHSWENYISPDGELLNSDISVFSKKPTNIKFLKHVAKITNYLIWDV